MSVSVTGTVFFLQNSHKNTFFSFFKLSCSPQPAASVKKKPWHNFFPASFAKILRTPFLQNISGRLLLKTLLCGERRNGEEQTTNANVLVYFSVFPFRFCRMKTGGNISTHKPRSHTYYLC